MYDIDAAREQYEEQVRELRADVLAGRVVHGPITRAEHEAELAREREHQAFREDLADRLVDEAWDRGEYGSYFG